MENKIKKKAVCMTVLAVIFSIAVCIADRQPIGPDGSLVGFASVNRAVFNALGVNMVFYEITEYLGYLAIAICVFFVCFGLVQAFKRKSLFKLDRDLFALAGTYLATIVLYVLFEKLPVNVRPIIMPGCTEAEVSFPSSHTMLICTVMGTAMIELQKRFKSPLIVLISKICCALVIALTVAGRLLSGVHWVTDIFGGVLFSLSLIFWFIAFAYRYD